MTRSLEALQRRAEKRSVSLDEQKKKDGNMSNKSQNKEPENVNAVNSAGLIPGNAATAVVKHKSPVKNMSINVIRSTTDSVTSTTATDSKKRSLPALTAPAEWICSKCSNKNFMKREICNRCGESRPVMRQCEEVNNNNNDNNNSTRKQMKTDANSTSDVSDIANPLNRKIKDIEKVMKTLPATINGRTGTLSSSNNWNKIPSTEELEENSRLVRILMENDEDEKSKLTSEQLDRAEVLYKRKLRKQLAKAKLQRYKSKTTKPK